MLARALPMPSRLVLLAQHLHQLTEGVPRGPVYTLLAAVSVPLYTSYVLLLQAVNTVQISTPVLLMAAGVGLTGYGWFLQRLVKGIEDGVRENKEVTAAMHRENKEAQLALMRSVEALAREQHATATLVGYLKERLEESDGEVRTLRKSFFEMDKIIDREIIHRKQP